jgi:hypothetical protein
MQAFLKRVFCNLLGLVVVTRTKMLQPADVSKKGRPKKIQYRLQESQPLVSPEALLVMVAFLQLNANEKDDAVIR